MIHVSRNQVVASAREWLDTPFAHQGRTKGVGVDCVGIVSMTAIDSGLSNFNPIAYSNIPNPEQMRVLLEAHLDYVSFRDLLPADILWLRAPEPQHLAIITSIEPLSMIHSFAKVGKVVETGVDKFWRRHIVACFRYRGIA